MPRPLSTHIAVKQFASIYESAYELARIAELDSAPSSWDSIGGTHGYYHPRQARKIVALAFMNMIGAWEEFLEAAFVRYLAKARSRSGYSPQLRIGGCESIDHAYTVLSGKAHYTPESEHMSWTNYSTVLNRARTYFRDGEPFSSICEVDRQRLADAVVIRNRIAHASKKCRTKFNEVALRHVHTSTGKLPPGFDPGSLLIAPCTLPFSEVLNPGEAYFYAYADLLGRAVGTISP